MFFYIFDRNDKANHNSTHKFWQKVVEASLIKATIVFYYYNNFFCRKQKNWIKFKRLEFRSLLKTRRKIFFFHLAELHLKYVGLSAL